METLEQRETPVRKTFDGLGREQLLIYAREAGEQFRTASSLQKAVSRYDQRLRDLTAASIAAQEEERQWIALEVHDRIAQTLASAFQQLQVVEPMARTNQKLRQAVVRASMLVRDAIREARNIMNDLHPPMLDEFGVAPLIEEEMRRFEEETSCWVRFYADCPEQPSHDVELAIYRIFHEALINVRRHANAQNVTVSLNCLDGVIQLRVEDDGTGFDVNASAATSGKRIGGLLSMRRRAEIIGGTFEIASTPGRGTWVTIRVPTNSSDGSKEGSHD